MSIESRHLRACAGSNLTRATAGAVFVLLTLIATVPAAAQDDTDISGMSLEQLMNIEVTSVSKKAESLSDAPAAVFVITSEDIERGGFTSIPEVLRQVPGLYVTRINADWWSVSARGFSDYLNNKMLVLVDGRSLYDSEFGGIDWDQEEIPMDHIDRIEIIRGPGGTLWGANAVNGVINIITKSSDRTQGVALATSSNPNDGYTTSVRYGGRVGTHWSYRVFGKAEYWYPGVNASGDSTFDSWNMSQGGARLDWKSASGDRLTLDGRGYEGRVHNSTAFFSGPGVPEQILLYDYLVKGGHLLVRWQHSVSERSKTEVLGYCEWRDRANPIQEDRDACDFEFQHNYQFSLRHSLVWGASVFSTGSYKRPYFNTAMVPASRRDTTVSGFLQYEFDIVPDRARIIAGSKFEHKPFTGFEIQPQIRGVWKLAEGHTLWGAVSRGVRVPSEFELDNRFQLAQLPGAVPTYLTVWGNPHLEAETMRAYEAGYRFDLLPFLSLDADVFYNHYDKLINLNLYGIGSGGAPVINTNPLFVEIPVPWENIGPGQTHGAELSARFSPVSRWQLAVGVTEVRGNSFNLGGSLNQPVANTPRHQFNIQSRFDLTRHLAFDSALYHYGGIPLDRVFVASQGVPTHNRLDLGLSVRGISGLTFSVWGRDLATDRHAESLPALFTTRGSYVRRSVGFTLSWESKSRSRPENPPASKSASSASR